MLTRLIFVLFFAFPLLLATPLRAATPCATTADCPVGYECKQLFCVPIPGDLEEVEAESEAETVDRNDSESQTDSDTTDTVDRREQEVAPRIPVSTCDSWVIERCRVAESETESEAETEADQDHVAVKAGDSEDDTESEEVSDSSEVTEAEREEAVEYNEQGCPVGFGCFDGYCLPQGCVEDADCPCDMICRDSGQCVPGYCSNDSQCLYADMRCRSDHQCGPNACVYDTDCTEYQYCQSGVCQSNPGYYLRGRGCGGGDWGFLGLGLIAVLACARGRRRMDPTDTV